MKKTKQLSKKKYDTQDGMDYISNERIHGNFSAKARERAGTEKEGPCEGRKEVLFWGKGKGGSLPAKKIHFAHLARPHQPEITAAPRPTHRPPGGNGGRGQRSLV